MLQFSYSLSSRDSEKQPNKRPKLSDLRESGSLQQDADLVFLLYRDWYYDKNADKDAAELNIAKNRDGRTGTIKIRFREETLTFTDWIESEASCEPTAPAEPKLFGSNGRDQRNHA
jgi:replicative DNA helicase